MSAGPHDELAIVDAYWTQLRAVDARAAARARGHEARRRLARTLVIAVLALLVAAAVALAAKALLTGDPAPRRAPALQSVVLGRLAPGSARLLLVRSADPGGGPAWGLRVFRTQRGDRVCVQPGRVVGGQLAALGVAGDFHDDGLAHRLPVESPSCTSPSPAGQLRLVSLAPASTTSGLVGAVNDNSGCLTPDGRRALNLNVVERRRLVSHATVRGDTRALRSARSLLSAALRQRARAPAACAAGALRTVIVGFAGSAAASVALTLHGTTTRHPAAPGEQGAFLFVVRGRSPLPESALSVRYADGLTCPLASPTGVNAQPSATCLRRRLR